MNGMIIHNKNSTNNISLIHEITVANKGVP